MSEKGNLGFSLYDELAESQSGISQPDEAPNRQICSHFRDMELEVGRFR